MCAPQLSAMLGCWAATNDIHSIGKCQEDAEKLFQCMRTTVRHLPYLRTTWTDDVFPHSQCRRKFINQLLITTLLDWGKLFNRWISLPRSHSFTRYPPLIPNSDLLSNYCIVKIERFPVNVTKTSMCSARHLSQVSLTRLRSPPCSHVLQYTRQSVF